MGELKLVGLHEDGEHLVLEGTDGQRFRLPIDEALRAAVRRDRAQLEQLRADLSGGLPPREIQARIRAGARAEDVAADAGMPVELVRRYEGPVLAEREHVARQGRATRIGHATDAPVLGELVTDRLATRGVDAGTIRWDSSRAAGGPWTVEVTFEVGDEERSARWTFDAPARTVRAQDDEARWLSETELADSPIPRRHLAAVPGEVDVDAALRPLLASVDLTPAPAVEEELPDPQAETQALLDDLTGRRGVRQQLELPDEDEPEETFEGFGPQHAFDFDNPEATAPPAAHPPHSRPDLATDAQVLPMPTGRRADRAASAHGADGDERAEGDDRAGGDDTSRTTDAEDPGETSAAADVAEPAAERPNPTQPSTERPNPGRPEEIGRGGRAKGRKGRASVPSWDEIVFGARPD